MNYIQYSLLKETYCTLLLTKSNSYISLQKAANGQVAAEKTSPAKKTSVAKAEAPKKSAAAKGDDVDGKLVERKQEDNKSVASKKEKEQISAKAGKENKIEQVKNKKNLKNLFQERPADFDDGELFAIETSLDHTYCH